jgi:hypothetical protein
MGTVLEPEVVKSSNEEMPVRLTKEGQPFRAQVRGKIDALPEPAKSELDHRLATNAFRNYRWLSRWLEEVHAARVSPSALNYRKKHKIDLTLLPVKYATQEARDIVAATGGDNEEINRVLTMVVQTKIFEMLIQINTVIEAIDQLESAAQRSKKVRAERARKAGKQGNTGSGGEIKESKYPSKGGLAAVSVLVKSTTAIGTHVREGQKWEIDREELLRKVAEATQKVSKLANEAGLSPAAEKAIRAAMLEIKP